MRLHRRFALILLAVLTASCSRPETAEVKVADLSDPFTMIQELLQSHDPFAMFGQVYPSFTFQSNAVLQEVNAQGEVYNQATSTTLFEQIEDKYYHIHRLPFDPVPSVELIFDQGLLYLRPHLQKTFYQIKKNPEVDHLRQTVLKEILSYFDLEKIKKEIPVEKQGQECYYFDQSFVCFDQQTKLPLRGKISQPQPQSSNMLVDFEIIVGGENIKVIQPEKVHSLRDHESI